MSSQSQNQQSAGGTQSPPLESTGSDGFMGVSSIDGAKHGQVSDAKQREAYFGTADDQKVSSQPQQSKKVGQSMQQKFEERT